MIRNIFKKDEPFEMNDPIQTEHEKTILPKVRAAAKAAALKGLPKLSDDKIWPYIDGFKSTYQKLYSKHNTGYAGENAKDLAAAEQLHSVAQKEQLEKKIVKLKDALHRLTLEQENLPKPVPLEKGQWVVHPLLIFIAITEGLFSRRALSLFDGNNNLAMLGITTGLVAVYWFLPIMTVMYYRSVKNDNDRNLKLAIPGAVLIGIMWVFGALRSNYLSQIGSTTMEYVQTSGTSPINPLYFLGVSVFFLMVSSMAYHFFTPDNETKMLNLEATELQQKISKTESDLHKAEEELHNIPSKLYQGQVRRSESASESKRLAEHINALYKEAVSVYMDENTQWRNGHERPDCFDTIIPDLQFNTSTTKSK